jgi:hypothetical protein
MATSTNAVPLFREEDRMGPSSSVPLLQIQKLEVFADLELASHRLHCKNMTKLTLAWFLPLAIAFASTSADARQLNFSLVHGIMRKAPHPKNSSSGC